MLTFSDVRLMAVSIPPMRYTPDAVSQDTWLPLASLRVCDWFQVPDTGLHLTQVFIPPAPPQVSAPFWLWPVLSSENWGREHLALVAGL